MTVHIDISNCECENSFTFVSSFNFPTWVCGQWPYGSTGVQDMEWGPVCVCVSVVNGAELLQSVKADCNGVIWKAIGKG